ncbi:MAG: DUF1080 domain-containing protein [Candidatus Solibacter sp.]
MRNLLIVMSLVCAAVAAAFGADNELTAKEKADGWQLLFDGKTFSGWEDPTKKTPAGDAWAIEDGCLKATLNPRIAEDLYTAELFGDFEMVWDWKVAPVGNTGVKYRVQDRVFLEAAVPGQKFEEQVNRSIKNRGAQRAARSTEYNVAFEYQLLDNERHPDGRRGPIHQSGALYDMIPPSKDATRPVGEFNQSRLVVKGDHVEHWLNGEKVVDGSLNDPGVAQGTASRWGTESPVYEMLVKHAKKMCPVSLQNHGEIAWFRNVKIRKL